MVICEYFQTSNWQWTCLRRSGISSTQRTKPNIFTYRKPPEDEVEEGNFPLDEILVTAGAGQMQQGWEMLPDPPNFQFVEVESFLLDCVKDELKEIRKRTIDAFRKKFPQKSFSQMTASQLSVVWVTP